ncbi:hypothetical protein [Streptomyces chumphonensis]|nr:hypothetical protein [Streptomyces chumphonensis]
MTRGVVEAAAVMLVVVAVSGGVTGIWHGMPRALCADLAEEERP